MSKENMRQEHQQEYGFLEEDELDMPKSFRTWREDTNQLVAARIFGGPVSSSKSKEFPNAFQTYRPEHTNRPFPFHMHRVKTKEVTPPAVVPMSNGTISTEHGALFSTVREAFVPNSTIQTILTEGIKLLPIEPLSTLYCAEPFIRPTTPPYFPSSFSELQQQPQNDASQ
jgi:hypothetical protein